MPITQPCGQPTTRLRPRPPRPRVVQARVVAAALPELGGGNVEDVGHRRRPAPPPPLAILHRELAAPPPRNPVRDGLGVTPALAREAAHGGGEVGGADRRRGAAVAVGVEGDADAAPALRQQHRRRRGGVAPPRRARAVERVQRGERDDAEAAAADGAAAVPRDARSARRRVALDAAEQVGRHARRVERLVEDDARHAARRCVGQQHDGARKRARELGRRDEERAHLRRPRRQLRLERERHRAHRAPCRVRARRLARCHRRGQPTCTHCCEPVHADGDEQRRRLEAEAARRARRELRRRRRPHVRSSSAAAASPTAPAHVLARHQPPLVEQPHDRGAQPRAARRRAVGGRASVTPGAAG